MTTATKIADRMNRKIMMCPTVSMFSKRLSQRFVNAVALRGEFQKKTGPSVRWAVRSEESSDRCAEREEKIKHHDPTCGENDPHEPDKRVSSSKRGVRYGIWCFVAENHCGLQR